MLGKLVNDLQLLGKSQFSILHEKLKRNGKVEYYQQMLGATIVNTDQRVALPLLCVPVGAVGGSKMRSP